MDWTATAITASSPSYLLVILVVVIIIIIIMIITIMIITIMIITIISTINII